MENKEKRTIYNLKLHQTLLIEEDEIGIKGKRYEATRVAGGWLYLVEYPGYRQAVPVFVPYNAEFLYENKKDGKILEVIGKEKHGTISKNI